MLKDGDIEDSNMKMGQNIPENVFWEGKSKIAIASRYFSHNCFQKI